MIPTTTTITITTTLFCLLLLCLLHPTHAFSVPAPPPSPAAAASSSFQRFKKLQNHFDLRGTSLASNGGTAAPVTLTPIEAYFLGQAFCTWLLLQNKQASSSLLVAVGRDSRLTGPALSYSLLDGIEAVCPGAGMDLGLCSTPATFHACLDPPLGISATGSVMVTASHLPKDRNGMKLFARRSNSNKKQQQPNDKNANVVGGLLEQDIDQIVDLAAHIFDDQKGTYPNIDLPTNRAPHHKPWQESHAFLRQIYGAHLATLIRNTAANGINFDTPLQGMKIVVNPGNGAGGFFLEVLQSCGADTSGSFNVEPDGHFPNCTPNPEDPQTMADTVKAVKQQGADLGIIFDPDCDRVGLVQGGGGGGGGEEPLELNRNRLIAMAAAVVLRDHPGTTIVTDSVTSEGLCRFISRRGGNHLRYKKGYRNVIEEAQRLNDEEGIDCQLAMECSGHAAFKENRFLDDGAFLAVKLLGEMASPFSSTPSGTVKNTQTKDLRALIADLEEPAEYVELRLKVREGHERKVVTEHILKAFYWVCDVTSWWKMEKDNYEGLRAKVQEDGGRKSGWLHFRPSLHDPVVSLTCESEMEGGIGAMLETLIDAGMMKATEEEVDWSAVMEYISRWHREKKQRQQQQQMRQQ